MNIPAILSLFKIARNPSLCLPHQTVSTFAHLPIPLALAFAARGEKEPDIRAVVLDKDNCFAAPHSNEIHPPYSDKFKALLATYTPSGVLIVSNSAGLASKDHDGTQADRFERSTGVRVLRHAASKPGCSSEIMSALGDRVTSLDQVVVIGDRLLTDVVMANLMGARAIWIRNGVVQDRGLVTRFEYGLSRFLRARGVRPPPA